MTRYFANRRGQAPDGCRRKEITILVVFGGAASVRVDAANSVDFPHLGKLNGKWQIVNVLWGKRKL